MPDHQKRPKKSNSAQRPRRAPRTRHTEPTSADQSNATAQDSLSHNVDPLGHLFNRIVGQSDDAPQTDDAAFTRAQLRSYLDAKLGFAEGEWFRGKKLDGVTDKLMESLDADKDGAVSWSEFQAFRSQTLATIAPGAAPDATPDQTAAKADERFNDLDTGRSKNGQLDFNELQKGTQRSLPRNTDHKDLIAQLAARIALDAADTDQRDQPLKKRELSRDEWSHAARGLSEGRQKSGKPNP